MGVAKKIDSKFIELMRCAESRDVAFEQIIDHFTEPLYWHVRRIVSVHEDAEDVVQDSFVKAYKSIDSFKGGEGELSAWLYRIATNCAISILRKRYLRSFVSLESLTGTPKELVTVERYSSSEEELRSFQEVVLSLPPKQQLVFNLRYYEEMPYEQISKILDQKVDNLKSNYHHAVKRIKDKLRE